MKVLVGGRIDLAGPQMLREAGHEVILVDAVTTASLLPHLPLADGVLLRTQPFTAVEVSMAPKLKIVSRHGVGFDAVDVTALNARKIPLAIVGDVNSRAVAEHTLALMLATARRVVAHDAASRSGNWNERNRFDALELDGKHLLVIGYGRIGKRVGELARAFGMEVSAYDPFITDGSTVADLNTALTEADVVTLHMPAAKGLVIGVNKLAMMKPSAIIINAARGGLVDEFALDAALRARKIYAAGLDVLVDEPPKPDHPLLSNPHITISPHNAGLTKECARRMSIAAAQNIIDCFVGKLDLKLVVNAEEIQ